MGHDDRMVIQSEDLPDGFYAVKDGILYQVSLPLKAFENAKTVTLPPIKWEGMGEDE